MTATIKTEHVFKHPPARVWRALTDPAKLGRWLMGTDFQAVVGHQFTFDTKGWGITRCEVLVIEPERLLSYSWRNPPLDTTVTWRLTPEGDGTRLTLEHAGFDLNDPQQKYAFDGMGEGWGQMMTGRLPGVLDAE
jgi:uncharacterized protein YndB with AHSA1/START domain